MDMQSVANEMQAIGGSESHVCCSHVIQTTEIKPFIKTEEDGQTSQVLRLHYHDGSTNCWQDVLYRTVTMVLVEDHSEKSGRVEFENLYSMLEKVDEGEGEALIPSTRIFVNTEIFEDIIRTFEGDKQAVCLP